jgi:hypothetical protein
MRMSEVWKIVTKFKDMCKRRGWRTSESEDWVEVKNKYHNFVWIKDVHPSSFKRIINNSKCVVREGLTYRVVESSYTAWLFSKTPSQNLIGTILENPSFCCKIAVYDLNNLLDGKNLCTKLNCTDSPVFKEFEGFLAKEFKVKLEPVSNASPFGVSTDTYNIRACVEPI